MVLVCVVCRGEAFDETNEGFYVCLRCGTQSQDVVRETQDDDAAIEAIRGAGRGVRSRKVRPQERAIDPRAPLLPSSRQPAAATTPATTTPATREKLETYCDGMRQLLHEQCVALHSTFGCPAETSVVAAAFWFPYVRACGVMELDFDDPKTFRESSHVKLRPKTKTKTKTERAKVKKERVDDDDDGDDGDSANESSSSSSSSSSSDADDASPAGAERKRRRKLTLRQLITSHLHPRVTLAIAYLACAWLKQPVHVGDLVRWALDGDMPYLAASARVHASLGGDDELPFKGALVARCVPQPHLIATCAMHVSSVAGIALPPANVAGFVARFASEVGVASAAFFQAAERAAAATDRARFTLDDARSDVQIAPPHAWAMAIVVVALKEMYGLDGRAFEDVRFVSPAAVSAAKREREEEEEEEEEDASNEKRRRRAAAAAAKAREDAKRRRESEPVVVAIDGALEWRGAGAPPPPPPPPLGWRAGWADAVVASANNKPRHPVASARAATSGGDAATRAAAADAFIAYCRDHAVGRGEAPTQPADRYADALWRVYDAATADAARAREERARERLEQERLEEALGGDGDDGEDGEGEGEGEEERDREEKIVAMPASAAAFASTLATSPASAFSRAPVAAEEGERGGGGGGGGGGRQSTTTSSRGRGKPPPAHRPPRKLYRPPRKLEDAADDYRAVLDACASHAWCASRPLHEAVRAIDATTRARELAMERETHAALREEAKRDGVRRKRLWKRPAAPKRTEGSKRVVAGRRVRDDVALRTSTGEEKRGGARARRGAVKREPASAADDDDSDST